MNKRGFLRSLIALPLVIPMPTPAASPATWHPAIGFTHGSAVVGMLGPEIASLPRTAKVVA